MSDILSATKDLRAWVCRSILPCYEQDGNNGIEGAEFEGMKPFDFVASTVMMGAMMDFSIPYDFDPQDPDGITCDSALALVYSTLLAATPYPPGLKANLILLNQPLPQQEDSLPAVGIYLVDDQKSENAGDGISRRRAIVQIEINNKME